MPIFVYILKRQSIKPEMIKEKKEEPPQDEEQLERLWNVSRAKLCL